MINAIRYLLKKARREGRHERPIDALSVLWHQSRGLYDFFRMGKVTRSLRARDYATDPDSLVGFAMDRFGRTIRPLQSRDEITRLITRVRDRCPETVLEIGTARGGSLFLFCQSAAEDATVISIDLPCGRHGGGYPDWKRKVYQRFARPGQTLILLRADSHLESTLDRVEGLLRGRPLDFMMIDGDHSYEGVRADYEMYSPLIGDGGMIAVHDIIENQNDPEIDVHRFWDEIRTRGDVRTEALIDPCDRKKIGIGLITRTSTAPGT